MQGMSERQYAAHAGLSRGAIQKAKAAERLVLYPDGSIDGPASDARRAETTDPSKTRKPPAPKLKPVPEAAVAAVGETLREQGLAVPAVGGGTTFLQPLRRARRRDLPLRRDAALQDQFQHKRADARPARAERIDGNPGLAGGDFRGARLRGDGALAADHGAARAGRHRRTAGHLSRSGWVFRRRPYVLLGLQGRLNGGRGIGERRAGDLSAGDIRRLDRSITPGPVHGFTVSKSGRDSLQADDGMVQPRLSRVETGTIVPICRCQGPRIQWISKVNCGAEPESQCH